MRIEDIHNYDDIIELPHHVSKKHPPMKMPDRAAQFGSFAALAGHSDAVLETSRLTSPKHELSESVIEILNSKLQIIRDKLSQNPLVTICYFKPDNLKEGGEYVTFTGKISKIDETLRIIHFDTGFTVPIDMIISIESDIFTFDDGFQNV